MRKRILFLTPETYFRTGNCESGFQCIQNLKKMENKRKKRLKKENRISYLIFCVDCDIAKLRNCETGKLHRCKSLEYCVFFLSHRIK